MRACVLLFSTFPLSSPSSLNLAAELSVEITRAVVRGSQTHRARYIHVCQISLGESERDGVIRRARNIHVCKISLGESERNGMFQGIQRRQFEAALCNVLKPEDIEVCVC